MVLTREKREIRLNLAASFKTIAPRVEFEPLFEEVRVKIPFGEFVGEGHCVRLDGWVVEATKIQEIDGSAAVGILVAMELSKQLRNWEHNGVRRAKWLILVTRSGAEIFRLKGATSVASAQEAYSRIIPAEAARAHKKGRIVRRVGSWFALKMARHPRNPIKPPTPMWHALLGEGAWKPLPALGSAA